MTSFATPAQLASKLKMDVDASTAQLALDASSGFIRAIARQTFDFVSQETIIKAGGERILSLPQRPLVVDTGPNLLTVIEVGEFGAANFTMVEDRDFSRIGNELTRGYPWYYNQAGRLGGYPHTRPLGVWAPKVQVTYSHGYVTYPDDLVGMSLDAGAVLYDNPTALRSFTIDDYTETKAAEMLGSELVQSIADKLGIAGRRRRAFMIRTA